MSVKRSRQSIQQNIQIVRELFHFVIHSNLINVSRDSFSFRVFLLLVSKIYPHFQKFLVYPIWLEFMFKFETFNSMESFFL